MGGLGDMRRATEGDLEKPLVARPEPVLYPNCPGCKVVQGHYIDDRLPTKELTVIALLVVCNSEHPTLLHSNPLH